MSSTGMTDALRETLGLFDRSGTPQTTTEVADSLDLGRRSTYERLERLVDRGRLDTKTVGANGRVWWRPVDSDDESGGSLSTSAEPLGVSEDSIDRPLVAVEDVTQLKRQARPLERQRDDLEFEVDEAVEGVDDAFYAVDESFRFTYVNDRAETVLGRSECELLGEVVWDVFPEVADTVIPDRFREALDAQESRTFETYYGAFDIWVAVKIYPSESGLSVYFQDVTERKEREREMERYTGIVDAIDEPMYELDTEGRFTFVNDALVEYSGYDEAELLGEHVSIGMDSEAIGRIEAEIASRLSEAIDDTITLEYDIAAKNGESIPVENRLSLLTDDEGQIRGTVGMLRDVTERKERERELERYETLFEESKDLNVIVAEDGTFRYLTPSVTEVLGYDQEELVGEVGFDYIHPDDRPRAMAEFQRMIDRPEYEPEIECRFERADGSWIVLEALARDLRDDPDIGSIVVYTRDVTERRERERALREARDQLGVATRAGSIGTWMWDVQEDTVTADDYLTEMLDIDPDDSPTDPPMHAFYDLIHEDDREDTWDQLHRAVEETGELEVEYRMLDDDGEPKWMLARGEVQYDDDGEPDTVYGAVSDIDDRKRRERELRQAKAQIEAANAAGSIGTWEWHVADDQFVAGPSFGSLFGIDPEDARDGLSFDQFTSILHEADRDRFRREIRAAVDSGSEFEGEYRVRIDDEVRWVVGRGRTRRPRCEQRDDSPDGVTVPGAFTDITDRKRAEAKLEQRREQLAALNSLNDTVRNITEAVIDQPTREDIERVVCEDLAETESYSFAWIGDVDVPSETVHLRTEAGVEGYLDDVTVSVDPDDPRSDGPTGRAIRTGEMQVTQDVETDARYDPWRDHVDQYPFRSAAAVPIVHEGTRYGVLNVYADRPNAFDGPEGEVVGQLGEVVGHAIAAAERKRALMSDEVVELEFRIRDLFDIVDVEPAGRIECDHAVPVADDTFLLYGDVTPDAVDPLTALVDAHPYWTDVTIQDDGAFELQLSDPPILAAMSSIGGVVDSAVIEDGLLRMTLHLAPGSEVRQAIDAVLEAYPNAELAKRQQKPLTPDDESDEASDDHLAHLTDRQRAAVDVAYHAGFFEWPRDVSGEEVAATMGIAPSTFHQHIRKAENKVLGSVIESASGPTTLETDE